MKSVRVVIPVISVALVISACGQSPAETAPAPSVDIAATKCNGMHYAFDILSYTPNLQAPIDTSYGEGSVYTALLTHGSFDLISFVYDPQMGRGWTCLAKVHIHGDYQGTSYDKLLYVALD